MRTVTLTLHQGSILEAQTAAIAYPADAAGQVGAATLQDRYIVAPTMKHPNEPIPPKQVELATVAALRYADEHGFHSLALPPFGTSTGQVDIDTAAKIIIETIQMFRCDQDLERVEVWLPTADELTVFQHYC